MPERYLGWNDVPPAYPTHDPFTDDFAVSVNDAAIAHGEDTAELVMEEVLPVTTSDPGADGTSEPVAVFPAYPLQRGVVTGDSSGERISYVLSGVAFPIGYSVGDSLHEQVTDSSAVFIEPDDIC